MGLIESSYVGVVQRRKSQPMCCVTVKPWPHSDTPEDVRSLSPSVTLTNTNCTWIGLGSNPGLHGKRPATNHVSHGTAFEEENEPELSLNIYSTAQ